MLAQLRKLPRLPFDEFKNLYDNFYKNKPEPHPAWSPTLNEIQATNLYQTMRQLNLPDYAALYHWSITELENFWDFVIKLLAIKFNKPYSNIVTDSNNIENIKWLPNAKLNIVESCFTANKTKTAIIYQDELQSLKTMSYGELESLVNQIANRIKNDFTKGDAIAINMPMTEKAVAIYLAIIKAGCVVVSIADSFAPKEIATRLKISNAKAIFTQDFYYRNQKKIELYKNVILASAPKAIVISATKSLSRNEDCLFADYISSNTDFAAIPCDPDNFINLLFSSGTTGEPKVIPWTHTTPIKAAMDAYFYQDVHPEDVIAWPTNLGWMMGPWLVYATLINGATMALTSDAPTQMNYGKFIQDAKVTILGLVPSIVSVWKTTQIMESFDWTSIKCFSSSGECSNANDYLYLMWLANNKPIIEYCGGTEIGGAYITSTLIQPNSPATFTSATLGIEFVLLSPDQQLNDHIGEVAICNPSIGLSQTLLNRDHHEVYFANMPNYKGNPLRRHGDQIEKIAANCYRALGRVDDTMNLGGIKVSSAEIERVLNDISFIQETAAVAIQPKAGGPSQLIIYAIIKEPLEKKLLFTQLQHEIKTKLNPLFKLHDVIIVDQLPRTASNKIMRRVLRESFSK